MRREKRSAATDVERRPTMSGGVVQVVALALACAGLLAFFLWRSGASAVPSPARRDAILLDLSDSAKDVCDSVKGIARRALASRDAREEFLLDVFATGGDASANEPSPVKQVRLPPRRRVLEGAEAARRAREKLLEEIKTRCDKLSNTDRSPIYMGLKRVLEQLRAAGCDAGADCRLWVQSDLEENVTSGIKEALAGSSRKSPALPPPLPNDGVRVNICGLSETNGQQKGAGGKPRSLTKARDPRRADRVREVWSQLFTNPDLVTFEPFCPRDEQADGGATR